MLQIVGRILKLLLLPLTGFSSWRTWKTERAVYTEAQIGVSFMKPDTHCPKCGSIPLACIIFHF